jgi:hypothetical protein
MREKLALIQQAYRTNPRAVEMVKARLLEEGRRPLFDVEHMRARAEGHIKDINEFMQRWRVLCVTTNKDSERMWSEYAENHKGKDTRHFSSSHDSPRGVLDSIDPGLGSAGQFKQCRIRY